MIRYAEIYKLDSKGKIRVFSIEQEDENYRMVTGIKDGKLVKSKWTVAKAKNVGKSNATTPEEQARLEIQARYDKKLKEGYKTDLTELAKGSDFFKPMLAKEWDKVPNKYKEFPLLVDPKLDGMRMTVGPDLKAMSRTGKEIVTVPHILDELETFMKQWPTLTLDGELYNHDLHDDFNKLMSLARKTKPTKEDLEASMDYLQFHVYDMKLSDVPDMTAKERKEWLEETLPVLEYTKLVGYDIVYNPKDLEDIKKTHILAGYEGTIVRNPDAAYENKRSSYLLKIKDFITEEYKIYDILSGKGNKSDIAGRVMVMVDDVMVGCGIRGSWKYCDELLKNKDQYIDKLATVRHFGKTEDGSLRFPVVIDINRDDL